VHHRSSQARGSSRQRASAGSASGRGEGGPGRRGRSTRPFVEFEKRIVAARTMARSAEASVTDWQAATATAALEREPPERWALPEVEDVLGDLELE